MHFLVFIITYPLLWLLSILPLKVLYVISDIFYILVYKIFGYRKAVVYNNIKTVFPDKTEPEIKKITKHFYKHFTDLFVETIKSMTISEKEIVKRYQYSNPEVVKDILDNGKSVAFVAAHQANWEWSVNSPLVLKHNVKGAYTTISNKYFNKLVKKSRERFGFECYKSTNTVKAIFNDYKNKIISAYLLVSDQSPELHRTLHWANFFNVYVPVHVGAENLAKKFDLAVVFCATKKVKRGYYSTEFKVITKDPKSFDDYEITEKYLRLSENLIKSQPECYLWSHRRFKHKDKFKEWQELNISKSTKRKK